MPIQEKITQAFTFPLKFNADSGYFFDQENRVVGMMRGWGHLSNLFNSQDANAVQDALGEMIATAFNEKYCK